MPIKVKSIQNIVGDPKVTAALQKQLQAQVSKIEKLASSASSALQKSTETSSGKEENKWNRIFKQRFDKLDDVSKQFKRIDEIGGKLAGTISKLSKSFSDLKDNEYKFRMKYLEGPRQPFGAARRAFENAGDLAGLKAGYKGMYKSSGSSDAMLQELKSSGKADNDMVQLMKQLVEGQKRAVARFADRVGGAGPTTILSSRAPTRLRSYSGTTPLAASWYDRLGIPPAPVQVPVRGTPPIGLGTGLPAFYRGLGTPPSPGPGIVPLGTPPSIGAKPNDSGGGMEPTDWLSLIAKGGIYYEAGKLALKYGTKPIKAGYEVYKSTYDASGTLGSDLYYGPVNGWGMRRLVNTIGGEGGRIGVPLGFFQHLGFSNKELLQNANAYGSIGGLESEMAEAAILARRRSGRFLSIEEWGQQAHHLQQLGFTSDISPAGGISKKLVAGMELTNRFIDTLHGAWGDRNFDKESALTMWNNALDIGAKGYLGSTTGLAEYTSRLATSGSTYLRSPEGVASTLGSFQGAQDSLLNQPVLLQMLLQEFKRKTGSLQGNVANWNKFMPGVGTNFAKDINQMSARNRPLWAQMGQIASQHGMPAQLLGPMIAGSLKRHGVEDIGGLLAPSLGGVDPIGLYGTIYPGRGLAKEAPPTKDDLESLTTKGMAAKAKADVVADTSAAQAYEHFANGLDVVATWGEKMTENLSNIKDNVERAVEAYVPNSVNDYIKRFVESHPGLISHD